MWNRRKGNKYNASKVTIDGQTFASRKEADRYYQLKLLEKSGAIKDLTTQVKFVLIPAQREPETTGKRGGVKPGKIIERELSYIADFCYTDVETGRMIVEDVKGYRATDAAAYRLFTVKRKLMLYLLGIRVKEV